ncbi:DUF6065 family protein [Polaromonas sp. P5_D5]
MQNPISIGTEFWAVSPGLTSPIPADGSLGGTVPLRAFRYCTPLITASALGWLLFPPMTLALIWDGKHVHVRFPPDERWMPLGEVRSPGTLEAYENFAPNYCRHLHPPLLSSFPENGHVQITCGYAMKTPPGVVSLVRGPINAPSLVGAQMLEGVIETDWWHGPILGVLRFVAPNVELLLPRSEPLFQVVPISRSHAISEEKMSVTVVSEMAEVSPLQWGQYYSAVNLPGSDKKGSYARCSRTYSR